MSRRQFRPMSKESKPTSALSEAVPLWMEGLAWYGTAAILGAYALNSSDSLDMVGGKIGYQVLNTTGATGVGLVCWRRRTWQPLVINVTWAVIGATALLSLLSHEDGGPDDNEGSAIEVIDSTPTPPQRQQS